MGKHISVDVLAKQYRLAKYLFAFALAVFTSDLAVYTLMIAGAL